MMSRTTNLWALLVSLLVTPVLFSAGCATVEEATQEIQSETSAVCESNFDEAWSYIQDDQRDRSTHKALALARSDESDCFSYGYSYNYNSRQDAVERALSECREGRTEAQEEINESFSECTVYSINGERQ